MTWLLRVALDAWLGASKRAMKMKITAALAISKCLRGKSVASWPSRGLDVFGVACLNAFTNSSNVR
jgi:hypothetical protein